jgi:hypothetical protein
MDSILENLLLANIKWLYMILKIKKIWPILTIFFVPRSLKTTRNNLSSPHNGPIKQMFCPKSYYLCITNNEIGQNSKSEPKTSHSCVALGDRTVDLKK